MKKTRKSIKNIPNEAKASEFTDISKNLGIPLPEFAAFASADTGTRRNRAATISPTNKYSNIIDGLTPFAMDRGFANIQETIFLVQSAYYSCAIVRQVIEVMTAIADSRIMLKGGNSTSRAFIGSWLKRIGLDDLKEQFFREYHLSGNIFLLRMDAKFDLDSAQTLSEIYGAQAQLEDLPLRYMLLNPGRIKTTNTIFFQDSNYYQILNPAEAQRLRYPKTPEDQALFDSLPPETQKIIKNNGLPSIPLDQEHLYVIFAQKQDYLPFAIPFIFPILEQINAHIELQRTDQALARTLDRAILLITNGAKKDEGGVNPAAIAKLQQLFGSESVSRTLVADYTTKAEWAIPNLKDLLGPEKYEELNRQINIGLNALFFGDNDTFANTSVKVKIFLQRLNQPRKKFITFLQNEINRVCTLMNFKNAPEAYFEDIQLKDDAEFIRLFTRMAELGIMTPQQFFTAIDTGELPDVNTDEYITEMQEYTDQRNKGMFLPLVGASMQDPNGQPVAGAPGAKVPQMNGRPKGSKSPQTVQKKVKPITASVSMLSLGQNTMAAVDLIDELEKRSAKANKLKELDDNQKHTCVLIAQAIMLNEERDQWVKSAPSYLKSIKKPDDEKLEAVASLADDHNVTDFEGTLLYLSKV